VGNNVTVMPTFFPLLRHRYQGPPFNKRRWFLLRVNQCDRDARPLLLR
jgi:hypothetical protein